MRLDEPRLILADDPLRHAALAEARQVAVLGPSPAAETLSEVLQEAATRQGLRLTTVTLDAGEMPLPSRLAGLEAVLVLALPLHDDEAQRRLFRMLSEARIAALALTDAGQVERGALLSLPNALDVDTFHRQLALRLDDVLAGRAPSRWRRGPRWGAPGSTCLLRQCSAGTLPSICSAMPGWSTRRGRQRRAIWPSTRPWRWRWPTTSAWPCRARRSK
ncbi:hypothetical protein [Halomonas sp. E19]|uniref:hypothetical protein n=1 Tax=Halomonas sp. E19 TaxID=3397247 RepID=UPI004033ACAA